MRRREFIGLIGGATAAWPLAVQAQERERIRQVGILSQYREGDAEGEASIAALQRGLQDLDWKEGRNIHFEIRWAAGDPNKARASAKELIGMAPDVIVPSSNLVTTIVQQETRTIPIVFILVGDPVGSGYVASMAHPGGNITGFAVLENEIAGKWVETLREIAPQVSRVGFIFHPETPANVGLLHAAESAAPSAVKVVPLGVHDRAEIERIVAAFAAEPGSGLIAAPHAITFANRDFIVDLAEFSASGGLCVSGFRHQWRPRLLRDQSNRAMATGRVLCRSRSQGRQARRLAGAISHKIRTRRQHQDCQGAGPQRPAKSARARRRGH